MNTKNLLASKTNVSAIVLAALGILSACGVSLPTEWEDIVVKTAVALFTLAITIAGRIQAGARAPEATSIFGFIINTADSLRSMLDSANSPSSAAGATSSPKSTGVKLTAPVSNAGLATALQTPGTVATEVAHHA